jgi:hypothetical protein
MVCPAATTRPVLLLLLALGAGPVLAGCSAPQGATADEVARWMADQSAAGSAEDSLGSGTAPIEPADGDEVPQDDGGITITFASPARVDGVRFTCLGDGTVDLTVEVTVAAADGGTTTEPTAFPGLTCGADEQPIAVAGATAVTVRGSGADRAGAWSAVVVGQEGA